MNREQWLTEMAQRMMPCFKGFVMQPFRVSCGWPVSSPVGRKRLVIGQCFGSQWTGGKTHEIFISPLLADVADVAGTLCHEMCHVAAGVDQGHKGRFIKVIKAVGLTKGKPTTAGPGDRLAEFIKRLTDQLPPYPHTKMKPVYRAEVKKLKAVSVECLECGCVARLSVKWVEQAGVPTCGCGGEMEVKL